MQPELFVITPPDAAPDFAAKLGEALAAVPVAAVLIQRGTRDEADYRAAAAALVPVAQRHGAAALVDNDPDLARALGADGVHVSAGIDAIRSALEALKPDMIVGAGGLRSRHDAMLAGEAGTDYVFFGSLGSASAGREFADMARWWVATLEVPAVWFPGDGGPADGDPEAEFLALRGSLWNAPGGPAAAIRACASALAGAA